MRNIDLNLGDMEQHGADQTGHRTDFSFSPTGKEKKLDEETAETEQYEKSRLQKSHSLPNIKINVSDGDSLCLVSYVKLMSI